MCKVSAVLLLALIPVLAVFLIPPASSTAPPQEAAADDPGATMAGLFAGHERCLSCHSSLAPLADVPIGYPWRSSMMANAARDPYWQGSVRSEVMDHPELQAAIEDKCATCHMPMARFGAAVHGTAGEVFRNLRESGLDPGAGDARAAVPVQAALAADGVSCATCHQIQASNFGERDSYSGHFLVDPGPDADRRQAYGPYEVDAGRKAIMRSSTGFEATPVEHLGRSELCATCHTLYTSYTDQEGNVVGELPEQVPYLEWLHSDYRTERSCQSCHMPEVEGAAPISSVMAQPRERVSRHAFRGGNRAMLSVLRRYSRELGVVATQAELEGAVRETERTLQESTATLAVTDLRRAGGVLEAEVLVENRTGHKLPTAYPSRRAWLHLTVRDATGAVRFESGPLTPEGAIVGNDNDDDAARFEPHHRVVERPDQVQIYEPILVDTEDEVTTSLLFAARYVKDNRLLPRGFDPASADDDVAVRGAAAGDEDFVGGSDRVLYRVPVDDVDGPLEVEIALLYQSIAYRWARNLARHRAPEIDRFLDIHEATAGESAVVLARATRRIR